MCPASLKQSRATKILCGPIMRCEISSPPRLFQQILFTHQRNAQIYTQQFVPYPDFPIKCIKDTRQHNSSLLRQHFYKPTNSILRKKNCGYLAILNFYIYIFLGLDLHLDIKYPNIFHLYIRESLFLKLPVVLLALSRRQISNITYDTQMDCFLGVDSLKDSFPI